MKSKWIEMKFLNSNPVSPKRVPMASPPELVVNGKIKWGTFDTALPKINLLDSTRPLGKMFPSGLNPMRLKEWQAFQIDSEEIYVLGALYQTGICAFNIVSIWNKKEKTLTTRQSFAAASQLEMADQLLDSCNQLLTKNSGLQIHNQLKDGLCSIKGFFNATKANQVPLHFEWTLSSCSDPSVVSMPLGANRGLYTHKQLFRTVGTLQLGEKKYAFHEGDLAIIDDHKGFYPYYMHYDWVTGVEALENGDYLAFNLTKNQVLSPLHYNENLLWVNGSRHPLPPVVFTHLEDGRWQIKDTFGYVNLVLEPQQHLRMKQFLLLANVDYHGVFGYISGTIKDQNGFEHKITHATGMGEDKTYRL